MKKKIPVREHLKIFLKECIKESVEPLKKKSLEEITRQPTPAKGYKTLPRDHHEVTLSRRSSNQRDRVFVARRFIPDGAFLIIFN